MEQKPVKIRIEYPFLSHCLGAKHLHIFVSTHSFSFTSSVFFNKKERRKHTERKTCQFCFFFYEISLSISFFTEKCRRFMRMTPNAITMYISDVISFVFSLVDIFYTHTFGRIL